MGLDGDPSVGNNIMQFVGDIDISELVKYDECT